MEVRSFSRLSQYGLFWIRHPSPPPARNAVALQALDTGCTGNELAARHADVSTRREQHDLTCAEVRQLRDVVLLHLRLQRSQVHRAESSAGTSRLRESARVSSGPRRAENARVEVERESAFEVRPGRTRHRFREQQVTQGL